MKQIEITEKQREKLLEMCKVLFPEYKYWNLHGGSCDLCMENTLDYSVKEKPKWNSWNRIHWFEFCMTYLCAKIGNSPSNSNNFDETTLRGEMYIDQEWIYNYHPIDFLYEEFKKLK